MNNTTTIGQRILNYMRHPFTAYQIDKAKRDFYNLSTRRCYVCDRKKSANGRRLEVHHLVCVYIRPDLACDYNNFVVVCRHCHYEVGHCGLSWKIYNAAFFDTARAIQSARDENMKPRNTDGPTE